jgi:hypothetical protein
MQRRTKRVVLIAAVVILVGAVAGMVIPALTPAGGRSTRPR